MATVALLVACWPLFAALAQPGANSSDEITEDFNAGHVARPDRLVSVDGFKPGDYGWDLDLGASGRRLYRIPMHAGSTARAHVGLNAPSAVPGAAIAGAHGRT